MKLIVPQALLLMQIILPIIASPLPVDPSPSEIEIVEEGPKLPLHGSIAEIEEELPRSVSNPIHTL